MVYWFSTPQGREDLGSIPKCGDQKENPCKAKRNEKGTTAHKDITSAIVKSVRRSNPRLVWVRDPCRDLDLIWRRFGPVAQSVSAVAS